MPLGTEDPVPDDCVVYRILKDPDDIKETGEVKTTAFSNSSPQEGESEEDTYMSVFLADEMKAAGKTVDDLLAWWPKGPVKVAPFTAGELRALGEEVSRHPIEDFPGHGGVRRSDRKRRSGGQKKNLARRAKPFPD